MNHPFRVFGRVSIYGILALLLVGVGLQFLPRPVAYHYELKQPLKTWLPEPLPGWAVEDVSIASTPEVQEAVDELLNFSDGIYRIYKSGEKQIKVYVAYWVPGKMDPRLVGVHSPDVCWVGAGWKQVGEKGRRSLEGINGSTLRRGHDRVFEIHGQREAVVFWHWVGGNPSRYLENTGPGASWWTAEEIFRNPLAPRYEQFFVRISTEDSLDVIDDTEMMKVIVERLSAAQSTGMKPEA